MRLSPLLVQYFDVRRKKFPLPMFLLVPNKKVIHSNKCSNFEFVKHIKMIPLLRGCLLTKEECILEKSTLPTFHVKCDKHNKGKEERQREPQFCPQSFQEAAQLELLGSHSMEYSSIIELLYCCLGIFLSFYHTDVHQLLSLSSCQRHPYSRMLLLCYKHTTKQKQPQSTRRQGKKKVTQDRRKTKNY